MMFPPPTALMKGIVRKPAVAGGIGVSDTGKQQTNPEYLCRAQYVLDNYATVEEAVTALEKSRSQ